MPKERQKWGTQEKCRVDRLAFNRLHLLDGTFDVQLTNRTEVSFRVSKILGGGCTEWKSKQSKGRTTRGKAEGERMMRVV